MERQQKGTIFAAKYAQKTRNLTTKTQSAYREERNIAKSWELDTRSSSPGASPAHGRCFRRRMVGALAGHRNYTHGIKASHTLGLRTAFPVRTLGPWAVVLFSYFYKKITKMAHGPAFSLTSKYGLLTNCHLKLFFKKILSFKVYFLHKEYFT